MAENPMAMSNANKTTPDREDAVDSASSPLQGVPLWRFSLKGLLILVTLLCVLFAWIGSSSFGGAIAVGLLAALVAAHVLGAVIGTRLRAAGSALAERKTPWEEGERDRTDNAQDV